MKKEIERKIEEILKGLRCYFKSSTFYRGEEFVRYYFSIDDCDSWAVENLFDGKWWVELFCSKPNCECEFKTLLEEYKSQSAKEEFKQNSDISGDDDNSNDDEDEFFWGCLVLNF